MFKAEIDSSVVIEEEQEQAVANAIVTALSTALGEDMSDTDVTLTFTFSKTVTLVGEVEQA